MIGYELIGLGFTNTTATTVILTVDATGGTFTLTVSAQTTSALAEDATAATLETAIELLSTVTVATVTGAAGGPWTITVDSSVTASTFTADGTSLTGGASTATFSGWYYTHTFTLPAADSEGWLTAYNVLGETGGFDRIAKDVRLSQITMTADNTGIVVSGTGMGLTEADSAGSEVLVADVDALLSQANGSFTLTTSDFTSATFGTPRSHTFTMDSPLDDTEQQLHSFGRSTLSPTGKTFSGTLSGLVFSENIYRELYWGSVGGTAPLIPIPASLISWQWQTPGFITGAVPYSFNCSVAVAQFEMQAMDVTGGGQILYDCNWRLLDAVSTAPITITLVNATTTYAGS
jgi:hypothetical protein